MKLGLGYISDKRLTQKSANTYGGTNWENFHSCYEINGDCFLNVLIREKVLAKICTFVLEQNENLLACAKSAKLSPKIGKKV
jgi:hypothetical protein